MAAKKQLLSLKNKTSLITGAASGIGKATALRFAQANSSLILIDRDSETLQKTKKEIQQNYKVDIKTHIADLSQKQEIDKLWQKLNQIPDILVNNAGIYPETRFSELTEKELKKIFDINFSSVLWMCQNFIRYKKRDGIIINISSIEAIMPFKADLIPYATSKAAVIVLTRSLAREYGKKGFRANVVIPGGIHTPGTKKLIQTALSKLRFDLIETGIMFKKRLALNRWGKADEIAKVILFLASDLSSYIQGAVLPIDGGFLSA